MKKLGLVLGSVLMMANAAQAMMVMEPARCAHDSLEQWTGGDAPIAGTARGRNEWLKVCNEGMYDTIFPNGSEFFPNSGGRRSYPTWAIITGTNAQGGLEFTTDGWVAPKQPPANADDPSCKIQPGYKFIGVCTSGCVTPESLVETPPGTQAIVQMREQNIPMALTPEQGLEQTLRMSPQQVRNYTTDLVPAKQEILHIKTLSGSEVRVSKNHPLLNGKFNMVPALSLSTADSLVTSDGKLDLIVSIEKENYMGRLYNLTIETPELSKSLYVVQGFISGDNKFQNQEISELNRKIFREIAFEGMK